jgi:hypothetical protein
LPNGTNLTIIILMQDGTYLTTIILLPDGTNLTTIILLSDATYLMIEEGRFHPPWCPHREKGKNNVTIM